MSLGTIDAAEFMNHLKKHDLVIVSRSELLDSDVLKIKLGRCDAMNRKAVTFKEIIDLQLLPLTSKNGIQSWIDNGKIKVTEVFTERSGKKRRMIMTSAIIRLGYVN